MRRAVHWTATGFVLFNLPLSALACFLHPGAYLAGTTAAVLVSSLVLALWAVGRCVRDASARVPLGGMVAVSYAALAAHLWTYRPEHAHYPPLFHLLDAGMSITAVVIGVRWALMWMPVFAATVAVIRSPALGWGPAVAEALLLLLSGLIVAAGLGLLIRADRTVVSAVSARVALEEGVRRASLRRFERERWDGLIHDKVLGALRVAGRSGPGPAPASARELACEALAVFRGHPRPPVTDPERAWRALAEGLGLDADVRVIGALNDPDVLEVLVQAAGEAITNVARHSGQRRVTVVAELEDQASLVTVRDPGSGFEVSEGGFGTGLRVSVMGRLSSIGGTATVASAPGRGTAITLGWNAVSDASVPSSEWKLRVFAPMMVLGVADLVLNVVLGAQQWLRDPLLPVVYVALAAVVTVTAAAAFLAPTARAAVAVVSGMSVTCAVLAADTAAGTGTDWRYWYLGALTPAVGALAFRFRPGVGPAGAVAAVVAVLVVDALAGRPLPGPLTGPAPVLFGTAVAGHLLGRGLDRAWSLVADVASAEYLLRMRIAAEQERVREFTRRVGTLACVVGPALQRICADAPLAQQDTVELLLLEGAVRDQFAAPSLVGPELALSLTRARSRGVRVDLAVRQPEQNTSDDPDDGLLDPVRQLLNAVLRSAPPGSTVRVTWSPAMAGTGPTIAVIGTDLDQVGTEVRSLLAVLIPRLPRPVTFSADEDSALIEFDVSGPPRR